MRIIANIPHPKISINIFSMNDKYQIQFLAGQMEQTFKIPHNEVNGVEGIQKLVDEEFLQKILERFNEMYLSLKEAKERTNSESNNLKSEI
ncbi:MAG: hypothetical protein A3K10_02110 [Bacteroidetes bacterium RIFCSPLOWO2_12_FULL_31_6]|nr:MAG: hypothetical protein A3K10_02110 [Bacteroidetes bacterium RIFCSPLOWO2_12_FULL_31_6]